MSTSVVRTTSPNQKDWFMLWFDDDPRTTIEQKEMKARAYYRNKYRVTPNVFMPWKPAHHFRVDYIPPPKEKST